MAITYELSSRLFDASLETVALIDGSYKIRVAQALQDQIADHEDRIDALELSSGGGGDITAVTAGTGLTGGGTSGAVSLAADFGSGAGKVTQGNDSRLSDARTPTGSAGGDLGGTYPNPTVEALGTTGSAVNVGSASAPSAGQVLTATDSTHATWQTPSGGASTTEALGTTGADVNVGNAAPPAPGQALRASDATHAQWESEGPPDSGHTDNVYFNGTADTLPSGWDLYRDGTGGSAVLSTASAVVATGAPNVGIDPYTPVAASGNDGTKVNFNLNSRRPGWLYFQAPVEGAGALRFAFAKKMASDLPATDFTIITKISYPDMDAVGSANLNGELVWGVCVDNSGPRGGQVAGGGRALILLRPDSASTGNMIATLAVSNGATGSSVSRAYSAVANIHATPTYLKIVRRGNTIYGFVGNGYSWSKIGLIGGSATGDATFRWWLMAHVNRNDGSDSYSSYIGFREMLRYDQTADVL